MKPVILQAIRIRIFNSHALFEIFAFLEYRADIPNLFIPLSFRIYPTSSISCLIG
jgi:hypothetical protein